MSYDPLRHHRQSIRLRGHDYTQAGEYYVTLCVKDRECALGEIKDGLMLLSGIGEIAATCWLEIPRHFPNALLDEFVIMPDHMHGILILRNCVPVGVQYIEPRRENIEPRRENIEPRRENIEPRRENIEPRRENIAPRIEQNPNLNRYQKVVPGSLSSIIRSYKGAVARLCHRQGIPEFRWQRNYYEHIIRDGHALDRIRRYIANNVSKWSEDKENPVNDPMKAK